MEQETKIEQRRFEESQLSLVRTSQVEWRLVRHFSRRFNSYIVDRIADKRFRPRQNVALFAFDILAMQGQSSSKLFIN